METNCSLGKRIVCESTGKIRDDLISSAISNRHDCVDVVVECSIQTYIYVFQYSMQHI